MPDPCDSEERWNAIGFVETILFVVYTERNDGTLRIISARKANKEEINGYKNNDFRRN
ncbi:BrnT family toxin [Treponema sp. OMZ 838]|uniref:BrnT family toxin n=1 Tax=Treponema sp. OMZ 838 TaxID=1539298 RepID=UPI00350FEFE9